MTRCVALAADAELTRSGPRDVHATSERILSSARELFACRGIDHTSIRAVAEHAGVDPAPVHYYFGTKRHLLGAAVRVPVDPQAVVALLHDTPVDELGQALPSLLLLLWDSDLGAGMTAALRSLRPDVEVVRSFLQDVLVHELSARVDNPPGTGGSACRVGRHRAARHRGDPIPPEGAAAGDARGGGCRFGNFAQPPALPHRRAVDRWRWPERSIRMRYYLVRIL